MILNTQEEKFIYNGITYKVGGKIYANEHSDYAGLVGTIIEIRDGSDKETENDSPDIYCSFEPPVFPADRQIIEEHFSALYRMPKTIDDISLDMVIMAPEDLLPVEIFDNYCSEIPMFIVTENWAHEGETGVKNYYYSAIEDAKIKILFLLAGEKYEGLVAEWSEDETTEQEIKDFSFSCWVTGHFCEEHYQITLAKAKLLYSPFIRKTVSPDGYVPIT